MLLCLIFYPLTHEKAIHILGQFLPFLFKMMLSFYYLFCHSLIILIPYLFSHFFFFELILDFIFSAAACIMLLCHNRLNISSLHKKADNLHRKIISTKRSLHFLLIIERKFYPSLKIKCPVQRQSIHNIVYSLPQQRRQCCILVYHIKT